VRIVVVHLVGNIDSEIYTDKKIYENSLQSIGFNFPEVNFGDKYISTIL